MKVSLLIYLITVWSFAGLAKPDVSSLNATANNTIAYSSSNLNFSSPSITQVATYELTVTVKNINGALKSSALVKLYHPDSSTLINTLTSDASGQVTFSNLSDGTYNYEVCYKGANHSPIADNTEYWGSGQVTIHGGSQSVIFTRSQPYIAAEASFTPFIVASGQAASGRFSVKNISSNAVDAYIAVWVDRDKASSWDYSQNMDSKTINSDSGSGFPFTVTPKDSGTFYCYAFVYTKVNGSYLITDQYTWYPVFTVRVSVKIRNSTISQIQWSGYTWDVKSGVGQGPGPNDWLADSSSVWVDDKDQLHLKIRKIGDKWYCASINVQGSFGYGDYTFQLSSNVETLDKNIVLGLFTYETDTREIDIEFSRWGDPLNPMGWYTIQPPGKRSQHRFRLNLDDQNSTHSFQWSPSKIRFQSYEDNNSNLSAKKRRISHWTYTGRQIPPAGNERLVLNLWLFKGNPPSDLKEAEVVIQSFRFMKRN